MTGHAIVRLNIVVLPEERAFLNERCRTEDSETLIDHGRPLGTGISKSRGIHFLPPYQCFSREKVHHIFFNESLIEVMEVSLKTVIKIRTKLSRRSWGRSSVLLAPMDGVRAGGKIIN